MLSTLISVYASYLHLRILSRIMSPFHSKFSTFEFFKIYFLGPSLICSLAEYSFNKLYTRSGFSESLSSYPHYYFKFFEGICWRKLGLTIKVFCIITYYVQQVVNFLCLLYTVGYFL